MAAPATSPAEPVKPNGALPKVAPPAAAAAGADPDDAPLPPLDHDAELKDQIKRAQDVVARDERKKAKAGKGKPAPKAKAEPKAKLSEEPDGKTDPAPPPAKDEPETPPVEIGAPSAGMVLRARELADNGDLDGALKLVFGKEAAVFRLNSARWAEWRKANDTARKETAAREQRVTQAAQRLAKDYGPLVEARKLFEAEDYEGAFQQAFGLDLNSFQKKALGKFHGKNPEIEGLKKQLAEEREERQRLADEERQRQLTAQQQQQHAANVRAVSTHLATSTDPEIVELSKRQRFLHRVYKDFLREAQHGRDAGLLTVTAIAEKVRDELVEEFGPVFGSRDRSASGGPHQDGTNPESPHRGGKNPARPVDAKAPPNSLSQRGAQEASAPGRPLTDEELFRKYQRIAEAKAG